MSEFSQFIKDGGIVIIVCAAVFIGLATGVHSCTSNLTECRMKCATKGYTKSDVHQEGNICFCDLTSKSKFKDVRDL